MVICVNNLNVIDMKNWFYLMFFAVLLTGCGRKHHIYIYTPDKNQCVTIFDNDEIRYIIDGKHKTIPDTNYIKLDVTKVPTMGDGIWICWENQEYKWDIVVDKSIVLESKIDTSKYRFNTRLPVDERGIPTEIKFRAENCAIFDFYSMGLSPKKGAVVEIK